MKMAVNIITIIDSKVIGSNTVIGEVRTSTVCGRKNVPNQDDMNRLTKRVEKAFIKRIKDEGTLLSGLDLRLAISDGYYFSTVNNCEIIISWANGLDEE
jgi:hypothetical protein